MKNQRNEAGRKFSFNWVKSENGNTYLCPVGALKGIDNPTEEDYRRLCVDESQNPNNA